MYPFSNDNVYLRNSWYVAAFADELDARPIERVIMDEPIVLFRTENGVPAAMWGICPHRHYPLAQGKVIGDAIECNYHGFRFDGKTGSCVRIPSQSASPRGFRQRVYPIVEHGPWLWIWPGDPEQADTDMLPPLDAHGLGDGWRSDNIGLLAIAGRAQLIIENLFDLTHVAFLHRTNLDGSSLLKDSVETIDDDGCFRAIRTSIRPWINGFYDVIFGPDARFKGQHETVVGSYFHSPAYSRTGTGNINWIEGHETVDRSIYGRIMFHHPITPETRRSCHYFGTFSRNYRLDDEDLTELVKGIETKVRMEDVEAANLIEERLEQYPLQMPELLARADTPAVKLRRRMQAALDLEQSRSCE